MTDLIPKPWLDAGLSEEAAHIYRVIQRVKSISPVEDVYPAEKNIFHALRLTAPGNTKVVLLGQDPYHGPGQAHGLSFSVPEGVKPPPSLRNILKERSNEGYGARSPDLSDWAGQGVLMLNSVLTVSPGKAGSHRNMGWERVTDLIIRIVSEQPHRVIFLLWGASAQQKSHLVDKKRHVILSAPHPSPLSAWRGFFGSKPFSRCNAALRESDQTGIEW